MLGYTVAEEHFAQIRTLLCNLITRPDARIKSGVEWDIAQLSEDLLALENFVSAYRVVGNYSSEKDLEELDEADEIELIKLSNAIVQMVDRLLTAFDDRLARRDMHALLYIKKYARALLARYSSPSTPSL